MTPADWTTPPPAPPEDDASWRLDAELQSGTLLFLEHDPSLDGAGPAGDEPVFTPADREY